MKKFVTASSSIPLAALLVWLGIDAASAKSYQLELKREEMIANVPVIFNSRVEYDLPDLSCNPIPVRLVVYLDTLSNALTSIAKVSGVERDDYCGDKVTITNARLWNERGQLHAKVDGHVGKQECIKTKIPEFSGFKVTMKDRVVASNTFETNVSLEASFTPLISNNLLTLQIVDTRLNVSNDIYRGFLDMFDMKESLVKQLSEAIDSTLKDPRSALQLPQALAGFVLSFDKAAIEDVDGKLSLVVQGTAQRNQELFGSFLAYLGMVTEQPAPEQPICR